MARDDTRLMQEVQRKYAKGLPLKFYLRERFNQVGLPGLAEETGVSKGTLWYWLIRFGIRIKHVAMFPDEDYVIRRRTFAD